MDSGWDSATPALLAEFHGDLNHFSPCPLYDKTGLWTLCVPSACTWLPVIMTSAAVQPGRSELPRPRRQPTAPTLPAGSALAKTAPAGPGDLRPVTDAEGAGGGRSGLPLAQGSQVGSGVSCGQPPGSGGQWPLPSTWRVPQPRDSTPFSDSEHQLWGRGQACRSFTLGGPSLHSPQAQKAVALSFQKLTS